MATYKNDFTKKEDLMMWDLHEVRNKIASKGITTKKINKRVENFLTKYKLKHLLVKTIKNNFKKER